MNKHPDRATQIQPPLRWPVLERDEAESHPDRTRDQQPAEPDQEVDQRGGQGLAGSDRDPPVDRLLHGDAQTGRDGEDDHPRQVHVQVTGPHPDRATATRAIAAATIRCGVTARCPAGLSPARSTTSEPVT